MNTTMKKINTWIRAHKVWSIVIFVAVLLIGYWLINRNGSAVQTKYVLGTVGRGNVVVSVSGTGQISSSNQVDLTSKASGDLIYLKANVGDEVKAGTLVAETDPGTTGYELESARLAYQKTLSDQPNNLRDTQNAVIQAQNSLTAGYLAAEADVAKAVTDLTDRLSEINNLLTGTGYLNPVGHSQLSDGERNYITNTKTSYYTANDTLKNLTRDYHTITADSSQTDLLRVLDEASDTAIKVSQAAKFAQDAVVYLRGNASRSTESAANSAYTIVTGIVSGADSTVSVLASSKNSVVKAQSDADKANTDLNNLNTTGSTIDLQSAQISLQQKQDAYNDHFVRAPFDGVIAAVPVQLGKSVSSGTVIATLITKEKVAEISLNEVDATKIKAGQKATLTFDAIDGLTLTGRVLSIDLVGTVSQGVVSYKVKIGLDTDDDRVRSGMTTTANIITDSKQDVITVSASAVKNQGGSSYVQVVNAADIPAGSQTNAGVVLTVAPELVPVTTGLASDDSVEIISGLNEGEQYVVRTVAQTTSQTTSAPSLFGNGTRTRTTTGSGAARPNIGG